MMETANAIYNQIAQNIVNSIRTPWDEAFIYFSYYGDSAKYQGKYLRYSNDELCDFKVGYQSYLLFKQLHEITSGAPEEKWNRVRFVLKRSGEFNIDYEWEQELTDEV